jgi:aspartate/methionine/tyrosine aminotransferase
LDPALTFRLISPSKRVAVHGFRFAYVLCPKEAFREYGWAYANINGPASCDALAFAQAVLPELSTSTISRRLMQQAAQNHAELRSKNLIESEREPELGYFVFERIAVPDIAKKLMNGAYFDLGRFDNVIKINLLSPSIPDLIAAAKGEA